MLAVLVIVAAYFCGSLPTGVWLGRRAGVDVRRSGSGNIGATNVARTAGLRPALLTLLGDIAKGLLPTLVGRMLWGDALLVALVALAAFFGHIFSVFLHFSGGKGVATGFGVCLALAPGPAALALVVFAGLALATRYVSLASMAAAGALPVASVAMTSPAPTTAATAVIAITIIARHHENIARLLRGTEPKFGVNKR